MSKGLYIYCVLITIVAVFTAFLYYYTYETRNEIVYQCSEVVRESVMTIQELCEDTNNKSRLLNLSDEYLYNCPLNQSPTLIKDLDKVTEGVLG